MKYNTTSTTTVGHSKYPSCIHYNSKVIVPNPSPGRLSFQGWMGSVEEGQKAKQTVVQNIISFPSRRAYKYPPGSHILPHSYSCSFTAVLFTAERYFPLPRILS
ncbi:hypothetical protein BDQ94DRAFT_97733 [Aspergillus welwitschiae]|uniref:Uncharacterized protein n=1 Tax=Aspergillus welwitschiae TaxID=1341132 RepID=A0A3F3PND3_9EURO|nr:hypothetical protein BDQ94DRAFT_97733 [Aspergillus welwitschiae]RDH28461.1 hypothetical protein BDQ94DRAFT_97733 [Aspergillus welwitschiae]